MERNTKPLVAIVGRPNVGKSTLFNRLAGRPDAVVSDVAGTTRDRVITETSWSDCPFILVDTGGLDRFPENNLSVMVKTQIESAIAEADVIIMLVDASTGINPADGDVAEALRQAGKPVVLVANKADNEQRETATAEFYELGLGDPIPVSAYHNIGIDDLMALVLAHFPSDLGLPELDADSKLAIVGRTNVGKSMLLNAICGQERAIVHEVPGTTRDALDTLVAHKGMSVLLIDTAGIRRSGRIEPGIERYSVLRSMRAIDRADVAVLVVDASELATSQDTHIASYILDAYKGIVLAVNKWDLAPDLGLTEQEAVRRLRDRFKFAPFAPVCFTSALRASGMDRLLDTAREVYVEWTKGVPRYDLRRTVMNAVAEHPPATSGKRALKIYGVAQDRTGPPSFTFYVNSSDMVHFSYQRYLENSLRAAYDFKGSPASDAIQGQGREVKDYLILVPVAYALGSVPFGVIAGWAFKRVDVRDFGSGSPGVSNVLRTLGLLPAILVLILDMGKAALAVLLARILFDSHGVEAAAGVAATVGHNWPVFVGFRGGKGTASGWAALLVLSPISGLVVTLVGAPLVAVTRYISLGSIVSAIAAAGSLIVLWSMGHAPVEYIWFGVAAGGLVLARHKDNIGRLLRGEENKLGQAPKVIRDRPGAERRKGLAMAKIGVVGTTSWGTTLAIILARCGSDVRLWARTEEEAVELRDLGENRRFVPGAEFPPDLTVTASLSDAFSGAGLVIIAVPSRSFRNNVRKIGDSLDDSAIVVSATKGLELDTGKRMSQVLKEELSPALHSGICAMSGPNLAREIIEDKPSSTVIASTSADAAQEAQRLVNSRRFRVYTNDDIVGVEFCGALKNIVALGAGICDGLGIGDNAKAAFMTRGLAEIARLGVEAGANPLTFAGLAGMGDLIATCSSRLSRNHYVGEQLAGGETLPGIRASMTNVAEGIDTTAAAVTLAKDLGVEMPIAQATYNVLFNEVAVSQAISDLLGRAPRPE